MTSRPPREQLRTGSLRARLLFSVLTVVALLLVVVVVATGSMLERQLRSSATDSLAGRAETAQRLLDRGADPTEIVSATRGENVAAQLITSDGRVFGDLRVRSTVPPPAPAPASGPGRPGPPAPGGPPSATIEPVDRQIESTTLSDGSLLTVAVDATAISSVRGQLTAVLVPVALAAAALAALLMTVAVTVSLRPLRSMTALARSITTGRRGERLVPTRSDTELGATAAAFDEMLDALEGAEARERAAGERSRRLFDDAAHDLRTPVAGMSAAAETLLRTETTDRDTRERLLVSMVRESRRASRLIDDLLAVARFDHSATLDRRPVNLMDLVRADADRLRVLTPELEVTVRGDDVEVAGDESALARVLANLTDNARRHSPPGATVEMDVSRSTSVATVRVRDQGPGVDPADRERIFDRLVRVDESRHGDGSGLGLTIARAIARAHRGDVTYEPISEGACFVVSLPVDDRTVR